MKTLKGPFVRVGVLFCALISGVVARAEEHPLPPGYVALEYIESTGSQYIDTGVKATPATAVTMDCTVMSFAGQDVFFSSGYNNNDGAGDFGFSCYIGGSASAPGNISGFLGYNIWMKSDVSPEAGTRYLLKLDAAAKKFYINGAAKGSMTHSVDTSTRNITLLYNPNGGTCAKVRLHSVVITENGVAVRSFIPCCDKTGRMGLWDTVEGQFHGNEGSSRFLPPDGGARRLNYIQSGAGQYIDTKVKADATTVMTVDVMMKGTANSQFLFGSDVTAATAYLNYMVYVNGSGLFTASLNVGKNGDWKAGNVKPEVDGRHVFVLDGPQHRFMIDNEEQGNHDVLASAETYGTLLVGAARRNRDATNPANLRLYSARIEKNGAEVLNLWPALSEKGAIGMAAYADGEVTNFFPNAISTDFTYGYAFAADGTNLRIYDGRLASDDDTTGFTSVEKTGPLALDAGAVTAYPLPWTISEGLFSFADGVARQHTFDQPLTLKGGAHLAIDLMADGCDSITSPGVVFDGATAANPLVIDVVTSGEIDLTRDYTVIAGGVSAADGAVDYVTANCGLPFVFFVSNGALLMRYANPSEPVVSVWRGNGADRADLTDPANWASTNSLGAAIAAVPTGNTGVYLPDGCVFNCTNGTPFTARTVYLPASIGGDCDWRGLAAPVSGTVRLNGHKLLLDHLNGSCTIMDADGDYQLLESITSTGAQRIDTGIVADPTTVLTMDMTVVSYRGQDVFFGATDGSMCFKVYVSGAAGSTGGVISGYFGNGVYLNQTETTPVPGRRYELKLDAVRGKIFINGEDKGTTDKTRSSTTPSGISLCAMPNATSGSKITLHGVTIEKGGTAVRTFVPALSWKTGEAGLLDTTGGDFYPSVTTTGFTAGAPIPGSGTGEVRFNVPAGKTLVNDTVALAGTLRVVKEGEGTFVAAVSNQTYSGGTLIAAGTARANNRGNYAEWGLVGGDIHVASNAVFDINGFYNYKQYRFVLDGGTLANRGANVGLGMGCNGRVLLTADSHFDVISSMSNWDLVDLNGHTLYIAIGANKNYALFWNDLVSGGTFTNGKVCVTSGGSFQTYVNDGDRDMRTVDFDLRCALSLNADSTLHVRDFAIDYNGDEAAGPGKVAIYGTFSPSGYIYNFILQDGAALDLSAYTAPFDVQGTGKKGTVLQFAEGATVTVKLGGRKVKSGERLVAWTDKTRPEGVSFSLEPGVRGVLREDATGLSYVSGYRLIVR